MQEELNQFERSKVWELVPNPGNKHIIGIKWVFKNKLDEIGIRNKARLVAQGYNQEEMIDFDETFAPVARLEAIQLLLVYACSMNFELFQMDFKSAFLNDYINEEVEVASSVIRKGTSRRLGTAHMAVEIGPTVMKKLLDKAE
ncbi:uncharacterized mitochondrial protein AtMg00820-like [Cicer arietinum]|uniref:uncharacterized mitochondrial protein AtMg00820-like n=1 Tax=Cicer arietinum TaxID=3827 RepID=UPI003CC56C8A